MHDSNKRSMLVSWKRMQLAFRAILIYYFDSQSFVEYYDTISRWNRSWEFCRSKHIPRIYVRSLQQVSMYVLFAQFCRQMARLSSSLRRSRSPRNNTPLIGEAKPWIASFLNRAILNLFLEFDKMIYIYIYIYIYVLGWQLSNCGFFLENQRQFFHGTK